MNCRLLKSQNGAEMAGPFSVKCSQQRTKIDPVILIRRKKARFFYNWVLTVRIHRIDKIDWVGLDWIVYG